jgi:hypothetical protein
VIFLGISKGDSNEDVIAFDETYGITYPSVSGFDGGGNQVHQTYQIQSTPTVIVITPDHVVFNQHVWEPTRENITAAVVEAGGILVGLEEQVQSPSSVNHLTLYPNPTTSQVIISFDNALESDYSLEVYNLAGQKVLSSPTFVKGTGKHQTALELGKLTRGIYYIRLVANNMVLDSKKIVLQ